VSFSCSTSFRILLFSSIFSSKLLLRMKLNSSNCLHFHGSISSVLSSCSSNCQWNWQSCSERSRSVESHRQPTWLVYTIHMFCSLHWTLYTCSVHYIRPYTYVPSNTLDPIHMFCPLH
jgi:hypothetical protein